MVGTGTGLFPIENKPVHKLHERPANNKRPVTIGLPYSN